MPYLIPENEILTLYFVSLFLLQGDEMGMLEDACISLANLTCVKFKVNAILLDKDLTEQKRRFAQAAKLTVVLFLRQGISNLR